MTTAATDQHTGLTGRRVLLLMGDATGGIAGHVASLGADLADAGVRVKIATTAASIAALPAGTPHVEALWPGRGASRSGLRRALAGADIVHAHGHQAGALAVALRATLPSRCPAVVITWHNALLAGGWRARAGTALEMVQVRGADLITGASSDLVQRARQLGAGHAELSLVAAPDLTPFPGDPVLAREELAAELGLPAEARWVLTVSRIAPQKNLPVLVEAARQVGGDGTVVWVVVGAGDRELEQQLRSQIVTTGAQVRLVGTRRDVPRLIAAADVLALPSQWEARSLVVQEALVGGLPCVVSAAGGLPDLVGDAGLLVPAGDATALAGAVRRVLEEPGLADELRARGLRQGAALPRPESVRDWWLERYLALVGGR